MIFAIFFSSSVLKVYFLAADLIIESCESPRETSVSSSDGSFTSPSIMASIALFTVIETLPSGGMSLPITTVFLMSESGLFA